MRSTVLQELALRIHEIEADSRSRPAPPLALGIAPLDQLLPEGRLAAGSLVELLATAAGAGTWTLALVMAQHVCSAGKALVIVDGEHCFYPPAAVKLGIDLDRSIVVRPRSRRDALLAMNQALRCSAVGAVVASHDSLRTLDARRLQLAAAAGGGVGFLLRPWTAGHTPSFAQVRLSISPLRSLATVRQLSVEVVRGATGQRRSSVCLEVSDETGHVHPLSEVAAPTTAARAARTSG